MMTQLTSKYHRPVALSDNDVRIGIRHLVYVLKDRGIRYVRMINGPNGAFQRAETSIVRGEATAVVD